MPVRVGAAEFHAALTTLLLEMPLQVVSSTSALPHDGLQPGSGGSGEQGSRQELARDYGQYCEGRGTPGDCLSLYDDGPDLRADDLRKIALALAVSPALDGLSTELRAMISPTRMLATVSISLTAYMALLIAPDPVLTKGIALGATVLLWAYLGAELFELIEAYVQLHEEAPQVSTFAELRAVGQQFGRVMGPNSMRILVMVGTAAVGETASLVSRASKLPGYGQAARAIRSTSRLRLDSALEASKLIISTNAGTLRAVLPMTALAMTAPKGGSSSSSGSTTPREGQGNRIISS